MAESGPAGEFPDVRIRPSLLEFGPPVGYPVQFRITGPDPEELRRIAATLRGVMRSSPAIRTVSDNWGSLGKTVTIDLDQDKARLLGLSSQDVSTIREPAPFERGLLDIGQDRLRVQPLDAGQRGGV